MLGEARLRSPKMLLCAIRRTPPRHGYRSKACRGVSGSSSQTRQMAAGHFILRQPAHSAVGARPILCKYCRTPLH